MTMNESRFLTKHKIFSKARIKYLSLIFVFSLMLFISFANIAGAAPVTIVEFNFEDATKRASEFTNYTADAGIPGNINVSRIKLVESSFTSSPFVTGSGGTGTSAISSDNWHKANPSYWYINFSTTGYKELQLSSKQSGSGSGPRDFKVQWSLNNLDWTDVTGASFQFNSSGTWVSGSLANIALPMNVENQANVYLRWIKSSENRVSGSPILSGGTNRIDDIVVKGNLLTYDISYDANGATTGTSPSDQIKTYGISLNVHGNTGALAKTGYTFGGWNTALDGSGTDYTTGASFTTNADTTLYAKWLPVTYIVTYNANGATAGTLPVNQVKTHNQDLSIFRNTGNLTKTGYTFVSWNTQADGGGTNYGNGDVFSINANTTLYAKWAAQNVWIPEYYNIVYDANGANAGNVPDAQIKTQYEDLSVLGNTGNLSKMGYTFAGWNTKADGSGTDYRGGAAFSINANTTLFARWVSNIDETGNENPLVILFIDFPGYVKGDKAYRMDVAPFINDKRTFVPVRFVAESFGATVDYDIKTKNVTITTVKDGQLKSIIITIASKKIKVIENGVERIVVSDAAASIKNGRTFLPLRAIGEILGAEFDYGPRDSAIEWVSFKMK